MAINYLPLKKMEELEEHIGLLDWILDDLHSNGLPKMTYDEYINLMLKLNTGELSIEKMNIILTIIFKSFEHELNMVGFTPKKFAEDPQGQMGELLDFVLMPYMLNVWRKNKQAYKPDGEFCNALLKTENLRITKDMMIHLPCNNFYVDLSECELFLPIQGIFVNIKPIEDSDKISIVYYLMDKDLVTWSSYDFLDFSVQKELVISQKFVKSLSCEDYIATDFDYMPDDVNEVILVEKMLQNKSVNKNNLNRNEVGFFVYQLLTYMVSHEPQIEESPITKSTYRPPKQGATIKNKFSEIQMHDVGVRFGKSFREQKRKYKCETFLTKHLESKRKSPIPHFRCAHWQGYWVGKGRTDHVVRWIEPVFINGEVNDVVIHKM